MFKKDFNMSKQLLERVAEQEQAMGIIQKLQINFKKTSKARLTRLWKNIGRILYKPTDL